MGFNESGRFSGCAVLLSGLVLVAPAVADELGVIRVESSTIDDRFDQKRDEPSNIAVVSGEAVDASHVENLQQVLQGIPGITAEVQAGDSLKIHIRGVENQVFMGEKPGVAVVIDGVPVFERTGRVNIDLDNIESIKVVKGGASYLFGDDALAGAVIITTKRGAGMDGYRLAGEAGYYGYRKGIARAGFAAESAAGHVQASWREGDGYHDDSAYKADYLNGKLQYYVDDTSDLTFGFELSERAKNSHGTVDGVTAAEEDPRSEDPAYNDYTNRYDVQLAKYFLTYAKDIDATRNLMVSGYTFSDQTEFLSKDIEGTDDYNYFVDYDQVQRGIKSEYRAGGERLGWMLAGDLRANTYMSNETILDCTGINWSGTCAVGALNEDNQTDETVIAAYGELKYRVAQSFIVTLNGRYDQISLDYEDTLNDTENNKDFNVTSWRLGGNYALRENLDVYANVSTGFRAPTVEQLFVGSNFPTSAVGPNPDLKPEYSLNQEIGMRSRTAWFGTPVDIDVAVFQLDRSDHIQSAAGQYTTGADNIYDNVGDMRQRGLEISLRSDPFRMWSWDLAYTYLDAEYTKYDTFNLRTAPVAGSCPAGATAVTDRFGAATACLTTLDLAGNTLPRVPNHHLNLRVSYRPAPGWLITGEADAISSYYADEPNRVKIDGREFYNLLVNYDKDLGEQHWAFFVRVDNLLDDQYYNTARGFYDSNEDGVFDDEDISIVVNPGRIYTAGVSVDF